MKRIIMIFAAMVAVLSSCSKNEIEPIPENESKDIVLNVSVSDPCAETKALIKTGWVKDDIISIWFDENTGSTPDLVIKYDADKKKWIQKKDATVSGKNPSTGIGKYVKALYNGTVKVASKDDYTYENNTLTFNIMNWVFLTELQVVVKNLPNDKSGNYTLACDKFTPLAGTGNGYTVNTAGITASPGTKGAAVTGISNDGGVAFVFATADYSTSNKVFTFTLKDKTSGSTVAKFYEPNVAIEATYGKSTIKALAINSVNFAVPSLSGVFSVGNGKKVRFSRGNLVATVDSKGVPTTWKFAANQYARLGEGGANKAIGKQAGDVDLFGWSADNKYGINTSTTNGDYSGAFSDWGKAIDDTWHTLTTEEWQYLIYQGEDKNHIRSDKAVYPYQVCDVLNCLILLPDNYEGSPTIPKDKKFSSVAWAEAEAAGFVCLPPNGLREGSEVKMTDYGYYWSSTKHNSDSGRAYGVEFRGDKTIIIPNSDGARYEGRSVRLVTDVQ